MEKVNSKNLLNFEAAYDAIPINQRDKVKTQIKEKCYLNSDVQFYNRKKGATPIPRLEQIEIIKIFQSYGVDAYTGEVFTVELEKTEI